MAKAPTVNSDGQKELQKAQEQFDAHAEHIKTMTMDRMSAAPKENAEPQTKIAQRDLAKMNDVYLKPFKQIGAAEKFNEDYRDSWDFAKEYVQFTAENREVIGETIELWTKPFPGVPAQLWQVPTNKPVWGPRYLAEKIKKCAYHRMVMQQQVQTENHGFMQMYGAMSVDTLIQRLDAHPVSQNRSIFMGAVNF